MNVCGQGEEEGRALLERFRLLCAEVQAEAAREAAAAALRAAAPVVYLSYRSDESRAPRPRQVILPPAPVGVERRGEFGALWPSCRLFLGPGFRPGARWNRLVKTVKTRKNREFLGKKWARYGLRSVKDGS